MISAILHIMFSDRVAKAMLEDFDEGGFEAFTSFCIALVILMAYLKVFINIITFGLGLI